MATGLRAGDRCGPHLLVRPIAIGARASIWEARCGRTGARRILKIIEEPNEKLGARLAQEAEAIARVEHVNVVRFHDAGALPDGRVWILLEYIEGTTLRERMTAPLELEDALRWLRQVAEGVAAAHTAGVWHRDLKPENILLTTGDVVKVIDFGLATLEKGKLVATTQGHVVGTAAYSAPEYISGQQAGAPGDVYALGLVLYETLVGANPIASPTASGIHVYARQVTHMPPPVHTVRHEVPGDVCRPSSSGRSARTRRSGPRWPFSRASWARRSGTCSLRGGRLPAPCPFQTGLRTPSGPSRCAPSMSRLPSGRP
jgi:serine/threonine-protein kinase